MSKKLTRWIPNILMVLMAIVITLCQFPKELEILVEDGFYQRPDVIPNQIKIIAIDETTLAQLGPYSDWERTYFADLIQILNEDADSRPKVIGIDVMFTGGGDTEGDRKLAEAVGDAGNVVLASKLEIESKLVTSNEQLGYYLEYYVSEEITAYEALNQVSTSGFTNVILDEDGYVRNAYTRIQSEGQVYNSFAYEIASRMVENPEQMEERPSMFEIVYTGRPGDFEAIPMSSVLDGTVPASYFADSVVLIGAYEEGMLDSYHVPIDHSRIMYGVECQANAIWALVENKQTDTVPLPLQAILIAVLVALCGWVIQKYRIRKGAIAMVSIAVLYMIAVSLLYSVFGWKLSLLQLPISLGLEFLVFLVLRYIEVQKKRTEEMQKMLFSMADSMAEAIEGRTPYNANHTKNVAKRSMEMLDYINKMHQQKRTDMYFTEQDKRQMYLAAMLHDIGKMDVPLEVMDKPTKLGHLEDPLRSRLEMIQLRLRIDELSGRLGTEEATARMEQIASFLNQLGGYNCGRPLKEEEWAFVDEFGTQTYECEDGSVIPYLTEEEWNDLHIKAGTLSEQERTIMQSHVVYTDKILNHVYFGSEYSDVRAIAANHHELLNAKGYPKGIGAEQIDTMTRILTIMDIYDSLIADDRPYKKPKPVAVAFDILDEEAEAGKIDKDLLAIAKEIWLPETDGNQQK